MLQNQQHVCQMMGCVEEKKIGGNKDGESDQPVFYFKRDILHGNTNVYTQMKSLVFHGHFVSLSTFVLACISEAAQGQS